MAYDPSNITAAPAATLTTAAVALFNNRPFVSSPVRAECFDCVAMVNALTGADIAAEWTNEGGDLPFRKIDLTEAQSGDLITFVMPWASDRNHVAVLTGDGFAGDTCQGVRSLVRPCRRLVLDQVVASVRSRCLSRRRCGMSAAAPSVFALLRNAAFYRVAFAKAVSPAYRDHLRGLHAYFVDRARAMNAVRDQVSGRRIGRAV